MNALSTALTFAHVLGWSVYLGGALAMEVLWRPAQAYIPPSQVNVVCGRMGRRYRWIALGALAVIGLSGAGRLWAGDLLSLSPPLFRPPLTLSSPYGRTMLIAVLLWLLLVVLVGVMAVVAHPALHVRTAADLTPEERARARESVRRAIRRMDVLLRCELVVAFIAALVGASLRFGGFT